MSTLAIPMVILDYKLNSKIFQFHRAEEYDQVEQLLFQTEALQKTLHYPQIAPQ